jgi:hypothetical protein
MTEIHDDPLREGANAIVGLASELSNVVMATQSLQLRLIGLKPDKDAPLEDLAEAEALAELSTPQLRAQQQAQARFDWQPALNDEWLAQATPVATARAWAAAVPFAENEASAALAMARAEIRLNEIHPEAMAEYRSLRSQGREPTDAMLACAELFDTPSASAQASADMLVASSQLSASPNLSAQASLTHDLGLKHGAHLGLEHPLSHNLHSSPQRSASADAAYEADLGGSSKPTATGFDIDEGPDAEAGLEDSLVAQAPAGATPEAVLQEDLSLATSPQAEASAGATLEAGVGPSVGAEGPQLSAAPQSEAARAAEISMRMFPDAHAAAERVAAAQLQPTSQPQKKKVLEKVLRRRR